MKTFAKIAAVAIISTAAVVAVTADASAAIACNGEGQCWHVHRSYAYRPEFGVVVHPNNWRWGATDHYTWREHTGRGYWHNGVWVTF